MRWRSACQPEKSRLSCLFRVDVDCTGRLFSASDYFGPGTKASAVRSVHTAGTARTKRIDAGTRDGLGQFAVGSPLFLI
jgi:hypothetical protein